MQLSYRNSRLTASLPRMVCINCGSRCPWRLPLLSIHWVQYCCRWWFGTSVSLCIPLPVPLQLRAFGTLPQLPLEPARKSRQKLETMVQLPTPLLHTCCCSNELTCDTSIFKIVYRDQDPLGYFIGTCSCNNNLVVNISNSKILYMGTKVKLPTPLVHALVTTKLLVMNIVSSRMLYGDKDALVTTIWTGKNFSEKQKDLGTIYHILHPSKK